MHVLLTADTEQQLDMCESYILPLLSNEEDKVKEHKRNQLIKLAEINGTIRGNDYCKNCGE